MTSRHFAPSRVESAGGERLGTSLVTIYILSDYTVNDGLEVYLLGPTLVQNVRIMEDIE